MHSHSHYYETMLLNSRRWLNGGIWDARQYPTDIVQIVCKRCNLHWFCHYEKVFFFFRTEFNDFNVIWRIKPQPTLIILKAVFQMNEKKIKHRQNAKNISERIKWTKLTTRNKKKKNFEKKQRNGFICRNVKHFMINSNVFYFIFVASSILGGFVCAQCATCTSHQKILYEKYWFNTSDA